MIAGPFCAALIVELAPAHAGRPLGRLSEAELKKRLISLTDVGSQLMQSRFSTPYSIPLGIEALASNVPVKKALNAASHRIETPDLRFTSKSEVRFNI